MRRILLCVLFAITTSAPLLSAQDQNSGLAHFFQLTRQGQPSQVIQAANLLLSNGKLPLVEQSKVMTYLAHAYQQTGDSHTAIGYYEKALAILDRDGHQPSDYATTLGALATLYAEIGQPDTAKHLLLRSIHLLEKDGDHDAEIAWIWNDLAIVATNEHSIREAHKYIARSIAESKRGTNVSSDQTAAILTTLATIAVLNHDPRTAIANYHLALTLWKQTHDDQRPETAWLYVLLGGAYLQADDITSAREMTIQGLNLLKSTLGQQSPRYLSAELLYAKVLDASGSHDEASVLRQEAQVGVKTESIRSQGEISISALR